MVSCEPREVDSEDQGRLTLRVPGGFHAEGKAAARELGVSFNALVLVALREFLDRRRGKAGVDASDGLVERPTGVATGSGGSRVPSSPVGALGGPIVASAGGPRESRRAAKRKKRKR